MFTNLIIKIGKIIERIDGKNRKIIEKIDKKLDKKIRKQ